MKQPKLPVNSGIAAGSELTEVSIRLFLAMLLGMVLGLFVYFSGETEEIENTRRWFALVGYGYIDLLRMLIIPLIPTSIIAGLMKLQNTQELKQMGG